MAHYLQISAEPWPIDWFKDGDRFLHFVDDGLKIAIPSISGRQTSSIPSSDAEPFQFRFGVTGGGTDLELCAAPIQNGVYLFFRSESEISPNDALIWLKAISGALRRLNENTSPMEWWAVIAGSADGRLQPALTAEYKIADLTLTPAASPYSEMLPPPIPQMASAALRQRWPVIVHGVATAHSFAVARDSAATHLGRLCALLSVATDHCWELLEAPRAEPLEHDGLPRSRMLTPPWSPEPEESIPVELPMWIDASFHTFATDASLTAALNSHHQGMLMEGQFPSFAVIAYTAAIETIGARKIPNGEPGQKFREGLKKIRTSKARQKLVEAYDLRSRTAHSGTLHAAEEVPGALPTGSWLPTFDSKWFFRLGPLGELRQASRELLTLGATGGLAPPVES